MYYLNSRYYDPEIGRFINADSVELLDTNILGLNDKNLFAYCDNNPINRQDETGKFWGEIAVSILLVCGIVAVGALVVATGGIAAAAIVGGGFAVTATATASTAIGVATAAMGVATVSVAVCGTAQVVDDSIQYYKEHTTNKTPSNRRKHEQGETRRKRDKNGEKGDKRRTPNPNKRRPQTSLSQYVSQNGLNNLNHFGLTYNQAVLYGLI